MQGAGLFLVAADAQGMLNFLRSGIPALMPPPSKATTALVEDTRLQATTNWTNCAQNQVGAPRHH